MSQPSYRTILKYYWMQVRKHRGLFFGIFIFYGVGAALGDIINPIWYRHLIDVVSSSTDRTADWPKLIHLVLLIGGTMVIFNVAFRMGDYLINVFQSKTMKNLADYAFAKLTNHSYQFFANNFSGSLVTKVKRLVRSFEDAHDNIMYTFWFTTVQVVGAVIALSFSAPLLAGILILWTVIYIFLAYYMTKKKIPYDITESAADSKVTGRLADAITNILNLKIFSSRAPEIRGFEAVTESERVARYRAWRFGSTLYMIQALMFSVLELILVVISLYLWREGIITVGVIVLVQFYLFSMFHNLWNLGKAMGRLSKNFADAAEIVEIFETPLDIKDPAHPEPLRIAKGLVLIDNVSFQYQKDSNDVLTDFTLEIPAGQHVGLVGHSGAGKSRSQTSCCVFGYKNGLITIDGQDIRNVTQDDLRSKIATSRRINPVSPITA